MEKSEKENQWAVTLKLKKKYHFFSAGFPNSRILKTN